MNPELPKTPREELEARLTALLLGELSADETAAVRRALAQDAELTKLHDRLQATIGLVRETVATHTAPAVEQPPLKLSDKRREELLAHFKTVPLLPKLASYQKAKRSWLIPMSAAATLVLLAGLSVLLIYPPRMEMGAVSRVSEDNYGHKRPDAITPLPSVAQTRRSAQSTEPAAGEWLTLSAVPRVDFTFGVPSSSAGTQERFVQPVQTESALVAETPATPPPPSAPRSSSSIVLPSLNEPADGAKLADTKHTIPDPEWADAMEQSGQPASPANRFLGRYAYDAKPTGDDALALAKPESWGFGIAGKSDSSGREQSQTSAQWHVNSAMRGFYDDNTSQDFFSEGTVATPESFRLGWAGDQVKDVARGRVTVTSTGQPTTGLPRQSVNGVAGSGGVVGESFYGGFAFQPQSSSPPKLGISEPLATGMSPPADAEGDKTLALGDTPSLGKQFYRLTDGAGGGGARGGGDQVQPAPGTPRRSHSLDLSIYDDPGQFLPRAQSVSSGLMPLVAQLPQPAFNVSDEKLAETAAKTPAPAAKPAADQETATLNFGVAAVNVPLSLEAKEAETVAGRAFTPLSSAKAEGESTVNAGSLVLSRGAAKSDRKQVAEGRERYLADSGGISAGGRVAPEEKVQSMEVDTLAVTTTAPRDAVGVVVRQADPEQRSVIVLPPTETGFSLGIEQAKTEEVARAKIAPTRPSRAAQIESARLAQDGKVLWELGKLDEAEAKLKQAKEAAPDDRTASYYMDLVKDSRRYQEARQRGVAGKSALVMTRQTGTGPMPSSEVRPTSELATLDERLAKSQLKASELRQELAISDAAASGIGTSPLLEAETLRRLEPLQINSEAQYVREAKLLEQLKATPKGEIKKILPTMIQDPQLTELNRQLNLAEQTRTQLKKDLPEMHPSVLSVNKQVQDLDRKIAERADGITRGLEVRVASMKGQMDSLKANVDRAQKAGTATPSVEADVPPVRKPSTNAPIPQPEVQTSDNAFSTFSLNVSDVAFKLAAASLEKGQMPDAASVRAEEFINAFDYRDPEAPPGMPVAFAWERARYPFAHNRDLLRFSVKTAAAGRQAGRPLNLVLLLDNSGSMERADRVQIIREALRVLAGQLQPQDKLSVITFARTPRLWVDGVSGDKSGEVLEQVGGLTPQGGTNLEEAMNLAYATALRHYLAGGINRVVLLTDGAANLGNVEPEPLKQKVEAHRKQGIAFDCFGIGWEGFNDDLLEILSRNGDGRYGFINSPEEAATEFAGQLAGALKVAASDVKVQVEFNPKRVTAYRQIGYAKHQLTKEQFRDNTVDAAEIAAQEAGNALYTVEVNPAGEGPLCIVRCRFKIPGTTDYREHEWVVPFTGNAVSLEQASPAMRLAASASAFAEWLVVSPFAAEVTPDALLGYLSGVPETYGADARPKKLEWMIRQAKSLAGN